MRKTTVAAAIAALAIALTGCEVPEEGTDKKPDQQSQQETQENLTNSQEQAIGSAESYLEFQAFSREGLIDQLKFEKFSAKDAEFAVDYLDIDWTAQAKQVAKDYLETQNFSRQGLIDQLKFEGFTAEQAEAGVKAAGL